MRLTMLGLIALLLGVAGWRLCTAPQGYATQDRMQISAPVQAAHPAGTDELGRDRAVRLSLALLLGVGGACCASALASFCTLLVSSFASFGPPWISRTLLYLSDLFMTLPWIFLLMLVRSALPLSLPPLQSGLLTFLLLGLLGIPVFLRLHHSRASALAASGWMLHAHATGLTLAQRLRSLLPHLRPLLLAQFLLYVPACLAAEANLGALGLGLSEPLPSLGTFIANLQSAALQAPSALVYLPIAVLVLVLLALELSLFGAES